VQPTKEFRQIMFMLGNDNGMHMIRHQTVRKYHQGTGRTQVFCYLQVRLVVDIIKESGLFANAPLGHVVGVSGHH